MNKMKNILKKIHSKKKRSSSLKKKLGDITLFSSSYTSLSVKEQTFFAKRLSFLIKAGVPMIESIDLIGKQTKSGSKGKIFKKITNDIANGQSLATSLSKFKGVFGNFAINIIRSGESSGTLTDNLAYLADELRKKEVLRKKIIGAMMYPLIVTIATFGITGLLTVYIFPKILPIFKGLHAKLPWSTRVIISISDAVRHDGVYMILGLILLVVAVIFAVKKVAKARYVFDGLLLRMPIFGKIVKNYNLTNTCRTLGLLLRSGITLTEALIITSETTDNMQYRKLFQDISKGVIKGKNISDLINHESNLFPPMLGHMVAVGEKSGNLSNTLIYLSEFYENEFEDQTKNLSSAIEPILMVIMGLMVGFVAISVITPIYEITNNLKH